MGKRQLDSAEAELVRAKLKELVDSLGTFRAVGEALGFPPRSDSQTIERAIRVRPGRECADKLYAYLGTTREAFMGAPPLTIRVAMDPETWLRLGLSRETALKVIAILASEDPVPQP